MFHRNSPPKDFYKEDFGLSCNLKLLGYGRNLISYSEPFMNQQEKRFWPHSRNTHRNPLDKKTLQFLEHYLHSFVLDRQFISVKVSKLGQRVGTISKNLVGTRLCGGHYLPEPPWLKYIGYFFSKNTLRIPLTKKNLQFLEHYLHSFVLDRQSFFDSSSKKGKLA